MVKDAGGVSGGRPSALIRGWRSHGRFTCWCRSSSPGRAPPVLPPRSLHYSVECMDDSMNVQTPSSTARPAAPEGKAGAEGDSVSPVSTSPMPRAIHLQAGSPQETELSEGSRLTGHGTRPQPTPAPGNSWRQSPRGGRGRATQRSRTGHRARHCVGIAAGPTTADVSTPGLFMNASIPRDKPFCIRLPWLP